MRTKSGRGHRYGRSLCFLPALLLLLPTFPTNADTQYSPLEIAMTAKKTSYESTIEKLGRPAEETTFRIGEIDGEFRVELYNIYPNDKGQNANVEIREATWH